MALQDSKTRCVSKRSTDIISMIVILFTYLHIVISIIRYPLQIEPTTFGILGVAQLAEHWASIPKVVGSIPAVVRHIFQACPVWIYTQSNITSIIDNQLKYLVYCFTTSH